MRTAFLLAMIGCQPQPDEDPNPGPSSTNTGANTPPGPNTTGPTTTPPGTVDGQRLTLTSGGVIEGERIAVYDMSVWWHNAEDDAVIAMFDPNGWADYPNDQSVRQVRDSEVIGVEAIPLQGLHYRDFLRDRGLVVDRSPLMGVSWVIMGNDGYHREEDGYGNYAWDLVKTDEAGVRYSGYGAANTDFLVWEEPVYLPVAGEVVEVVRDAPDNTPGAYAPDAVNNLVGIWLGGQHYLYLLHFRQNTIPAQVQVGAVLDAGTFVGNVGNSGVTLEPHLHVTAHRWDASDPLDERMWSVPIEWKGLWTSASTSGATEHDYVTPASFDWISSSEF